MRDNSRKREYISVAYEMIMQEGIENVTIRKVASKIGVSSTALYRHFSNLDELLAFACVRFLSDYAEDLQDLQRVDADPMQLNAQLWESFIFHALNNPRIFEFIYFGPHSSHLHEVVTEFYTLFPEELGEVRPYLRTMMESGDLFERNRMIIARAAEAGIIDAKDVDSLSRTDIYLFRGMLAMHRDEALTTKRVHELMRVFMGMLVNNYNSHMLKGQKILSVSALMNHDKV